MSEKSLDKYGKPFLDCFAVKFVKNVVCQAINLRRRHSFTNKVEKEKVLAKAKEDAARKAEIDAAKKVRDDAKADYDAALKVCREALSRWSAAEKELIAVENRNRSVAGQPQTYDDLKRLIEKWFFI